MIHREEDRSVTVAWQLARPEPYRKFVGTHYKKSSETSAIKHAGVNVFDKKGVVLRVNATIVSETGQFHATATEIRQHQQGTFNKILN